MALNIGLIFTILVCIASANNYFIITNDIRPVGGAHDGALDKLLDEFMEMTPRDKIYAEVALTLLFDSEVRSAYKFLKTDDFYNLMKNLESRNEYTQLIDYLNEEGLDVPYYIEELRKYINIPANGIFIMQSNFMSLFPSGGVDGLLHRLVNDLPLTDIRKRYDNDIANNEELKRSISNIYSTEFSKMTEDVRQLPEYVTLEQTLKSKGIDIEKYIKIVYNFFAITSSQVPIYV